MNRPTKTIGTSIGTSRTLKFIACLILVSSSFGLTQSTGTPPAAEPLRASPVPLPQLYRHFLAYQNHLDRVAADLEAQGKDGSEFRNHFQRKLGFSDVQFTIVREAGLRLGSEIEEQDSKARALITAIRGSSPVAIKSVKDLPQVPKELTDLQQHRDVLIEREVTSLKTALGAAASAQLEALMLRDFAPGVVVRTIDPGSSQQPIRVGVPLPHFEPEVPR